MNRPPLITIIGRGHSGTRAMSHTLSQSGVDMGSPLNVSGDLLPPEPLYDACRVMAPYVRHLGGNRWDFSQLHTMPIPEEFTRLVKEFLTSVTHSSATQRGWKLPETTLIYPWILRLFPDLRVIYWVRDPRDSVLSGHLTDDLGDFGIPYERSENVYERRAASWLYQTAIYHATPPPQKLISIRFEDFVLDQEATLQRLEAFLEIPLARIPVRADSVGRWKQPDAAPVNFPCFAQELERWGYER